MDNIAHGRKKYDLSWIKWRYRSHRCSNKGFSVPNDKSLFIVLDILLYLDTQIRLFNRINVGYWIFPGLNIDIYVAKGSRKPTIENVGRKKKATKDQRS